MEFKKIMAISGMSGLFEMQNNRGDGLIVRSIETDKVQFVPGRTHNFSPLENITVYTTTDAKELKDILIEMKKQEKENPASREFKNDAEVKDYFKSVVPDYDTEKVYVSDMKKIIRWFVELDKHNLLPAEEAKTEEAKAEGKEESK
jgi:hypothetical protein